MQMQMVHTLTPIHPIIHNNPKPPRTKLPPNPPRPMHQLPEYLLMPPLVGLGYASETVPILWNHQDVNRRHGGHVVEREDRRRLVHLGARDGTGDYLGEDRRGAEGGGGRSLRLF